MLYREIIAVCSEIHKKKLKYITSSLCQSSLKVKDTNFVLLYLMSLNFTDQN